MASPIPLCPAGEYYIVKFETSVTLYKCWSSYLLCAPTAMTCGFFVAMKSFNLCSSFSCHSSNINIRHVLIRLHLLFTSTITTCNQFTATRAAVWAYLHTQQCEHTFSSASSLFQLPRRFMMWGKRRKSVTSPSPSTTTQNDASSLHDTYKWTNIKTTSYWCLLAVSLVC